RATARALNAWQKALAVSRANATAFTTTIDRAGAARAAHDRAAERRQMLLAITLARHLASGYAQLLALTPGVAKLAATSKLAPRGLTAKQLTALRVQLVRHGLTPAQRTRLLDLGLSRDDIAALVKRARDRSVPTSQLLTTLAQILADPAFVTQLNDLKLFF